MNFLRNSAFDGMPKFVEEPAFQRGLMFCLNNTNWNLIILKTLLINILVTETLSFDLLISLQLNSF